MISLSSVILATAFAFPAFAAIGPVADLHIVNANISPDGTSRPAVLAGGTFPGTVITGNKGDHFQLTVHDDLTDASMLKSTSIHWHGFFQAGTNWADGPAFVNQCPIATGNSFTYDFHVPDQAGTFWYHSHLSTQYCDGLRGAFIVYDPNDPHKSLYDVDNESTIITLADWYHVLAQTVPVGVPPTPDSTLINGLGRSSVTSTSPLAVISVTKGKRYRFRLINISCDPNYVFSIDSHSLTIIEADGVNTQPLQVDSIQIYAGQRYSFILNANQLVGNYWIRASPSAGNPLTGIGGINSAILRYTGASNNNPISLGGISINPFNEKNLKPLNPPGVPGSPTQGGVDLALNMLFAFNANGDNRFTVNGASFVPPTVPVLLQILSGQQNAANLLPSGSVYSLPANKVIEISMPGGVVGGGHPFHLHGHTFHVVRSAGSTTYNYVDPVIRDVVNIGAQGDNTTIRFVTDNPGPWFLHCHIDWHLEAGFAVVFAEDIPHIASSNPVPQSWSNLCPTYNALAPGDL